MLTITAKLLTAARHIAPLSLLVLRSLVLTLGALAIILAGLLVQIGLSWIFP